MGPELRRLTGSADAIVLGGVSTERGVLATALAAVDDGVFVLIVADACGARTPKIRKGALSLLEGRAPQLVISDTGAQRARLKGGDMG